MSRREIIINTLLGSFLVLIFSLIVAAAFLALRFVAYLLDLFLVRFLPGVVSHQEITLAAILAGLLLVEMINALRWRRWREAFLDFALVCASIVLVACNLRLGNTPNIFWLSVMVFFGIRPKKSSPCQDIDRSHFFLGVTAVSTLFAAQTNLLGTGLLSQIVRGSTWIGLLLWFAIRVRKGWEQTSDLLDPNSASVA